MMKIVPFSSCPNNIEFFIVDGPMKGRVVFEWENEFALDIHIKSIRNESDNKETTLVQMPYYFS